MKHVIVLAACLMLTMDMRAQVPSAQDETQRSPVATTGVVPTEKTAPVFRSTIELVALNVVVTDLRQQLVGGLSSSDFVVLEEGVRQDVSFFAASDVALDLAILLDTSASMNDKMGIMQRAALGFANTLRPGDRAMIVDIKDATKVIHPLGAGPNGIAAAIKSTRASGGTGLYNGLYMTLKELMKARTAGGDMRRQAIVVLSDGDDTTSLLSFDDVMEVAKQAGIATYTITLRSPELTSLEQSRKPRYFSESEFSMKLLAQETGGQAFFPLQIGELDGVYSAIAKELATQYALGYTPKTLH